MPKLMIMCKPRYFNLIYINQNGPRGKCQTCPKDDETE